MWSTTCSGRRLCTGPTPAGDTRRPSSGGLDHVARAELQVIHRATTSLVGARSARWRATCATTRPPASHSRRSSTRATTYLANRLGRPDAGRGRPRPAGSTSRTCSTRLSRRRSSGASGRVHADAVSPSTSPASLPTRPPAPICCARSPPAPPRPSAPRSCARWCATWPRRSTPRSRSPEVEEGAWERRACSPRTAAAASSSEGHRFRIPERPASVTADRDVVAIPAGTREAFPGDSFVAPRARGLPRDRRARQRRRAGSATSP